MKSVNNTRLKEVVIEKIEAYIYSGKRTLASIISFAGGFGLGAFSSIFFGKDFTDMINDLEYSRGLGYIIPGLYGSMIAHNHDLKTLDYLMNISVAEAGYILGSGVKI